MRRRASAAYSRLAKRFAPVGVCAVLCLLLAHCASSNVDSQYGVAPSPRVVDLGEPVPKGGGTYRVGAPYVVSGRTYVPHYDPHYKAVGLASWYGDDFYGRYTANGEIFDLNGISAAHPTMPLPSYARVTDLENGRSIIVRVNDRGPYAHNRLIDLSARAAKLLDFYRRGTAPVRVEYMGPAPLRGSDDAMLASTLREDRPASLPKGVRLAGGPVFPPTPPPPHNEIVASASRRNPPPDLPDPAPAVSSPSVSETSDQPTMDGSAQVLNGRGLY